MKANRLKKLASERVDLFVLRQKRSLTENEQQRLDLLTKQISAHYAPEYRSMRQADIIHAAATSMIVNSRQRPSQPQVARKSKRK